MPARDNRYSVHVKGRGLVEYKDRDRTVEFETGMLDGEIYLGREKVTAGRLDPGQRELGWSHSQLHHPCAKNVRVSRQLRESAVHGHGSGCPVDGDDLAVLDLLRGVPDADDGGDAVLPGNSRAVR